MAAPRHGGQDSSGFTRPVIGPGQPWRRPFADLTFKIHVR